MTSLSSSSSLLSYSCLSDDSIKYCSDSKEKRMETDNTYNTIWNYPIWQLMFSFPLVMEKVCSNNLPKKHYFSSMGKSKRWLIRTLEI